MSNGVRFFDFSRFHGKPPQGSTNIRVNQVIKYWDEAGLYKYGENPDVLIFQKVYVTQDYRFPVNFEGITILDICDPDWLGDSPIVETCNGMDAVTCSTQALADFIGQFHDNVHVVPDRFDLEVIPKVKPHKRKAKTVVWFGYSHNSEVLRPAIPYLDEYDLNLIFISNDDAFIHRFSKRKPFKKWYTFVKYDEATIYAELQKADFAILPDGFRPQDAFKSNNKTIKANLAGLPVAKNPEEVKAYLDPKARQSWLDDNYVRIRGEYDVRQSVNDYKRIIKNLGKSG